MRSVFRFCGAALCCVLLAAGAAQLITRTTRSAGAARLPSAAVDHDRRAREKIFGPSYPNPALETFVDPNAPAGSTDRVFLDPTKFDGTVFSVTVSLAGENREPGSLKEYREVIGTRAQRARRIWSSGARVCSLARRLRPLRSSRRSGSTTSLRSSHSTRETTTRRRPGSARRLAFRARRECPRRSRPP